MSAPGSSSNLLSQDSESQGSESRGSALSHFATSFLTGGFSAAATKTLFAPIDRVKIVLQTQDSNPSIRNGTHRRFEGVSHTFRRIYAEQGLTAFWRGNTASVLRSFPTQSLNFAFWGTIKGTLLPEDSAHTTSRFVLAHIGGGALAGALTTTIVRSFYHIIMIVCNDTSRTCRCVTTSSCYQFPYEFVTDLSCLAYRSRSAMVGTLLGATLRAIRMTSDISE